ncbi:Fis family transcriptional regulator [Helicobacter anseris]|uniref:Fis family transcriptional regulator n=1 Tax=Helicobacter anseris TaxID=375926 RepID=A0A3D8J931_9HELI|nr:YifB family Mg chelatase-like AAA ATPase [Helicobacter anseris]RDU74003.1 Fis family transcriptional regulator [Helicobacter anseris]
MVRKIFCATRFGLHTKIVEVEVSFTRGLPAFLISGLATNAIQESKQRVHSALSANGFNFPPLKITINLSPADLPKYGSHFDLPIALLIAMQKQENTLQNNWFAFGELGLDGTLKHSNDIFALVLDVMLFDSNACIILPKESEQYFSFVPNLRCVYASNLKEAMEQILQDTPPYPNSKQLTFPSIKIRNTEYFYLQEFKNDFKEVRGQIVAKRAALIAAAGFHNLILEGSPGCGKSMIIKRLQEILPPMSLEEIMQNARLNALNNQEISFLPLRNFKSPHQSASKASILGSASNKEPKPGEIALAHQGILFFDELPYFKKEVLESLREPLENNCLVVSRVHSKITYETSFLFAGAQNPCPCGNLLSLIKECRCSEKEIKTYKNKLSQPFLDRIDLFVQMKEIDEDKSIGMDSKTMQQQVFDAFIMQKQRGQKNFNAKMSEKELEKFCTLSDEIQDLLARAVQRFGISERSVNKLRKIARTIADLDKSEVIQKSHMLEALSYRRI